MKFSLIVPGAIPVDGLLVCSCCGEEVGSIEVGDFSVFPLDPIRFPLGGGVEVVTCMECADGVEIALEAGGASPFA